MNPRLFNWDVNYVDIYLMKLKRQKYAKDAQHVIAEWSDVLIAVMKICQNKKMNQNLWNFLKKDLRQRISDIQK